MTLLLLVASAGFVQSSVCCPSHVPPETLTHLPHAVAEFASSLQSKLPETRDAAAADALIADLSRYIQTVEGLSRQGSPAVPRRIAKDLEHQGRDLWNLCIRAGRDIPGASPHTSPQIKLLVRARLFSFLVLEAGRRAAGRGKKQHGAGSEAAYLLKLALTLGRICIGDEDLDSARLALQKAAEYVGQTKADTKAGDASGTEALATKLEAEYLSMRMALVRISPPQKRVAAINHWSVVERGLPRCRRAHVLQNGISFAKPRRLIRRNHVRYDLSHC